MTVWLPNRKTDKVESRELVVAADEHAHVGDHNVLKDRKLE